MSDLWLPSDISPARMGPRLIDNTARFVSPLSGAVRTVTRPGDRWAFRVDYENLTSQSRARIEAFIANQRGAANRALIGPKDYKQRGVFPSGELLANGNFASGTTRWTATGADFKVADSVARVYNSGAAAGRITSDVVTLTPGVAYAVRVLAMPGNQTAWKIAGGTTAGGTDVFNITPTALDQMASTQFVATNANFYLSLYCNTTTAADYIHFAYASVVQCGLVNGASQTGSMLKLNYLPTSTANLLMPGDWLGVNFELKRLTAPIHGDSDGIGWAHFAPPLRAAPSNGGAVFLADPLGRFIASGNETGWETMPGHFMTASIDFVEST